MNKLQARYDVTAKDLAKGRNMKLAAVTAPLAAASVPAAAFMTLFFLFGTTPPAAAMFLFLGMILTAVGFFAGLVVSGVMIARHGKWTKQMRERIAADGIKADEIGWFVKELNSREKRSLKAIESSDVMLADAYRETLASRLTATRIVRSSQRELVATRQRKNKLKYLQSKNADKYAEQIRRDEERLSSINSEAKMMLAESQTRLQMIEAASARGGHLADSELALKKLSARTEQLPLALEEAKMAEEIRLELENEDLFQNDPDGTDEEGEREPQGRSERLN